MKKIILILLFSFSCYSQATNFIVSKEKLVWENVFISNETNIPGIIARHSRLTIFSSANTIYTGKATDLKNTCPGTSDFIKDDLSFNFEIELRDGKYRVTISNLVFCNKVKDKKINTPAEKYFIEKSSLKPGTVMQTDLGCLENYFIKLFSARMTYKNRS